MFVLNFHFNRCESFFIYFTCFESLLESNVTFLKRYVLGYFCQKTDISLVTWCLSQARQSRQAGCRWEQTSECTGKRRDLVAWGRHISHSQREVKVSGPRKTTQARKEQAEIVGWRRCDSTGCRTSSLQVGRLKPQKTKAVRKSHT